MKTKIKDLEMETCPREGVVKEEKLPHNRKYFHRLSVGSCGVSATSITGKKKRKPTEYTPNHNYQWRSGSDTHICHQ